MKFSITFEIFVKSQTAWLEIGRAIEKEDEKSSRVFSTSM